MTCEKPRHWFAACPLDSCWRIGPLMRALRNDLESIPMDWLAITASLFISEDKPELQKKLLIGYTVCRAAHTVCQVKGLQPFRSISYIVSKAIVFSFVYRTISALRSD